MSTQEEAAATQKASSVLSSENATILISMNPTTTGTRNHTKDPNRTLDHVDWKIGTDFIKAGFAHR